MALCYKGRMKAHDRDPAVRRRTELEHRERINKVSLYIQVHIDEPLQLKALARIAGFSPYHFHRIFAAHTGETVAEHVRRIRLERAARQLRDSAESVTEVALAAGYETPAAFGRAFKQRFGVSPSGFRGAAGHSGTAMSSFAAVTRSRRINVEPGIQSLPEQKVLYVRRSGLIDGNFNKAAKEGFAVLHQFLDDHSLGEHMVQCLGITPDDPALTSPEQSRYDAGVILRGGVSVEPEGEVRLQVLQAGKWAVFLHEGPYETLWQTWNSIYRDWLPSSGRELRDVPPYEVYLNDPKRTEPEDLRTEIYIPVR